MSAGHGFLTIPAGRFCRSTRWSSAPSELPQIFHVAVDLAQLVLEPCLLLDAENGPRRRVLARIRNAHIAEVEFGGRLPAIEGAARVERDHCFLREVAPERRIIDLSDIFGVARVVAAEAVLVGNEEVEVLAVAERPISDQAADRGQIVRLDARARSRPTCRS